MGRYKGHDARIRKDDDDKPEFTELLEFVETRGRENVSWDKDQSGIALI